MKKLFVFLVVFFLMPVFAFGADFSYKEGATLGLKKSWGTFYSRGDIVLDGATVDSYKTTFTIEDPTANRTITLPDYTGGVPLVIGQGATQTVQAGIGSDNVTGSAVALPAGWLTATKTLRWTVAGTRTGADSMKVHLEIFTTGSETETTETVMTLEPSPDENGDFLCMFTVHEYTDTAHQVVTGHSVSDNTNGTSPFQVTAKTYDMSVAKTFDVKIESTSSADTVTSKYVLIETFTK